MKYSDSISAISKALAEFQGEVQNLPKTADNPFFKSKYTPLDNILEHARPLLSKRGLAVLQFPCSDEGRTGINTLLIHSSGEWIEGDPLYLKPAKDDPQGAGAAITYARRYALSAVLGIASDDDDDGNAASGKAVKDTTDKHWKAPPVKAKTMEYEDGKIEVYSCKTCGKRVMSDIALKSLKANGEVYCSGTCKNA